MIRLFTKCLSSADWITSFDAGTITLPASWDDDSELPECVYQCDRYKRWCMTRVVYGELTPGVQQFTYGVPANCKPGIWTATVELDYVSLNDSHLETSPIYNAYILLEGQPCCGPPIDSPVFNNQWTAPLSIIQESVAGDGSDVAAIADQTFDFGVESNLGNPCSCACREIIKAINGPWDTDAIPTVLYSWSIHLTAVWVSDFPP